MNNTLIAGLSAVVFAAAIFSGSAEAGTKTKISLSTEHVKSRKTTERVKQKLVAELVREKRNKSRKAQVTTASTDRVVGLIKGLAPKYGVPVWFALRIAKVEFGL